MKAVIALLFAAVAVAHAGQVLLSSPWAGGYAAPWAYAAAPVAYAAPAAVAVHAAPVATVVAAPAIAPGYVAATRGSVHTAPLPVGPSGEHAYASHHINTAPAPGTH